MTIGYTNPGYPVRRTILDKCCNVQYVRAHPFRSAVAKFLNISRLSSLQPFARVLNGCYYSGGVAERLRKVDLLHLFNDIVLPPCKKPYITTFETTLPRKFAAGTMTQKGYESLLSNQCRRLIALSTHARSRQFALDAEFGARELDKKITVLLPPQEALAIESDIQQRMERGSFNVVFAGKDFFRKGGSEIVKALVQLRKDFNIEAYLIGDYGYFDYASSAGVDSPEEMWRLFSENKSWLHHFRRLPNNELMALAMSCHVGLLPTRDDTFGFSVLEFQACGLPCITTDIRALPEVNNEEIGWLVKVPRGPNGCADFSTIDKMRELSMVIEHGLVDKMRDAFSKPGTIAAKGMKALARIKCDHNPATYGEKLCQIYSEAMG